jgi:hypothetical protein
MEHLASSAQIHVNVVALSRGQQVKAATEFQQCVELSL